MECAYERSQWTVRFSGKESPGKLENVLKKFFKFDFLCIPITNIWEVGDVWVDTQLLPRAHISGWNPLGRVASGECFRGFLEGHWASQVVLVVKDPPANAGDVSLIPGLRRSPGVGNGTPLQYPGLRNSTHRGATDHGVEKSRTRLSDWAGMEGRERGVGSWWRLI